MGAFGAHRSPEELSCLVRVCVHTTAVLDLHVAYAACLQVGASSLPPGSGLLYGKCGNETG